MELRIMSVIKIKISDKAERDAAILSLLCGGKKVWVEDEMIICFDDDQSIVRVIPYYAPTPTVPQEPWYKWPETICYLQCTTSGDTK